MSFTGTKLGADGRRYPAGDEPTVAADYRPVHVKSDQDILEIAQVETTTFGRSLLALPDSDALSAMAVPETVGTVSFAGGGGTETANNLDTPGSHMHGELITVDPAASVTVFAYGGSTAFGKITAEAAGGSATVRASNGSLAFGYCYSSDPAAVALIKATSMGSLAFGYASENAEISTGDRTALAGGYADSQDIKATGYGAIAFGYASGADILATANNCMQLGHGTNSQENSISAAGGVRINGSIPTSPRNGDIWVDGSGNIQMRTGGVTKNVTTLT